MHMMDKGFTMNEEMASFLLDNPDIDVHVEIANGANSLQAMSLVPSC